MEGIEGRPEVWAVGRYITVPYGDPLLGGNKTAGLLLFH